jgi:hypothetical protein
VTLYSTKLAQGVMGTTGPEVIYIVPMGYRAVLRCFDAFFYSGGASPVSLSVNGDPACLVPHNDPDLGGVGSVHWEGYQVLNAGDVLYMSANFANESYWLSGYLLIAP